MAVPLLGSCARAEDKAEREPAAAQDAQDAAERSARAMAETAERERMTFFNPLLPEGPDPWMVFHDGYYYFTCTSGNEIRPSGRTVTSPDRSLSRQNTTDNTSSDPMT